MLFNLPFLFCKVEYPAISSVIGFRVLLGVLIVMARTYAEMYKSKYIAASEG